ncbi:MAG TPA: hypothetical protein VMJ64_05495, partial [Anaerolineales bacterium]|nr:hypothetical protein [Anaerolineales bacterium]
TITPTDDFFKEQVTTKNRYLMWTDEAETIHYAGAATDPIHNLGYLESTASEPARKSPGLLMQAVTRPDFRLMDADIVAISSLGSSSKCFALITEQYAAPDRTHKAPRWTTTVTANEIYENTAGGALPSTIERVSNYTPLNTSLFNKILSANENNLQAAMDKLDDHTHSSYALQAFAASFSPADATTYYFGSMPSEQPQTTANRCRIQIPANGTIHRVRVLWASWGGVAGSGESITFNVRLNNTTSYLIVAIANTSAIKTSGILDLNLPVTDSDAIEIEVVCPNWATNPTLVRLAVSLFIGT